MNELTREMQAIKKMCKQSPGFRANCRVILTLLILGAILLCFLIPWAS